MKKIYTLTFFILTAVTLFAQGGSALLIPADSRATAMGVSALQPAAEKLDAQAFYGMWAPKTANNTIVGVNAFYRLNDKLSFTFEGRDLIDKPYTVSNALGTPGESYTPTDLIIGLGATYSINDQLTVGAKAHILSSGIAPDVKGSAFCADISAVYGTELFTAGLGLKNLGSKIDYGAGGYSLPALVAISGTVSPIQNLNAALEVDYLFSGALMAGLGVEYTVIDMISVRGGFHYGDAEKALPTYVSLGLGAQFSGIHLDATFLTASETLGNTLLIGVGYSF